MIAIVSNQLVKLMCLAMDLCINSKIAPYEGPAFENSEGPGGDHHLATQASPLLGRVFFI